MGEWLKMADSVGRNPTLIRPPAARYRTLTSRNADIADAGSAALDA